jgi:hypothetical protein
MRLRRAPARSHRWSQEVGPRGANGARGHWCVRPRRWAGGGGGWCEEVVGEATTDVILAAVAQAAPRTMQLVRDAVPHASPPN